MEYRIDCITGLEKCCCGRRCVREIVRANAACNCCYESCEAGSCMEEEHGHFYGGYGEKFRRCSEVEGERCTRYKNNVALWRRFDERQFAECTDYLGNANKRGCYQWR